MAKSPISLFTPLRGARLSVLGGAPSPSREEWWLPRVWVFLPAYFALVVALGAACRALAHFITDPHITLYLWSALILNCAISFAIECGNPRVRRWTHRLRLLVFLCLPLAAAVFNHSVLAPLDAETEINAGVALLVGWTMILSVLLVGANYGDKRLPFAAPLVPGLSLFGLLNSLSVDTLIQICFLIFVAASLYLIVYEQMLHRLRGRMKTQKQEPAAWIERRSPQRALSKRLLWPGRDAISRTAVGYLAACSVWFAAFLGGAALFYYPVEAILPRMMSGPLNAVRGASAALLDWRGASPVMELRGGNYPLSDRAVLNVEMVRKSVPMQSTPVLWRGRIYEQYDTSRWTELDETDTKTLDLERESMTRLALPASWRSSRAIFDQAKSGRAHFSPKLVRRHQIEAFVQPQRGAPSALFFPGDLAAVQGAWRTVKARPNGTYVPDGFFRSTPYGLRANIKEERLSGLLHAPGLSRAELTAWKRDATLRPTLELPDALRAQLMPIMGQIHSEARSFDTPYAKASAIRNYLVNTCTYSLSAPLVPANQDAVIFFMTQSKRGACDMFASSMVLLLRSFNVPARLATGYIEPEELTDGRVTTGGSTLSSGMTGEDANGIARVPSGDGTIRITRSPDDLLDGTKAHPTKLSFALREKDAHAWVEYFVPGAGWLTYDPTAGTRTTEMPLQAQLSTIFNLPSLNLQWKVLWLPLCGLMLIGIGLGWSVLDKQKSAQVALSSDELDRARIGAAYEEAAYLLRRRVPRAPHQTLLEYEAAVHRAPIPHPARQEFAALTYLLMAARYRSQPPVMGEIELRDCLKRFRHALRQR